MTKLPEFDRDREIARLTASLQTKADAIRALVTISRELQVFVDRVTEVPGCPGMLERHLRAAIYSVTEQLGQLTTSHKWVQQRITQLKLQK